MSGISAQQRSTHLRHVPPHCLIVLAACIGLLPAAGYAQAEEFLQCADLSDREARVACLETALETAVKQRDAAASSRANTQAPGPAIQSSLPATPATPPPLAVPATDAVAAGTATTEPADPKLFGLFARERDEAPLEPVETLAARITVLEYFKPDIWTITLDNGQVWRQLYSRRFNLREGDAIQIYSTRWGKQFRLEAERINGYIQVERIR